MIAAIDAGVSINCADISITYDAVDGLITTNIDAYGLIANSIDAYGLIGTPIKSTDCDDTNVLDDDFYRLTMFMF